MVHLPSEEIETAPDNREPVPLTINGPELQDCPAELSCCSDGQFWMALYHSRSDRLKLAPQVFVRRHRTAALATADVGLALILGAGVAAGQAYRATSAEQVAEEQFQIANEQRQLAEEAATRESQLRVAAEQATKQAEAARTQAEAVTKYLVEAFRSPDPAKDGRTITVAEILDRAARELDTQFADQPAREAQLLLALGQTYCGPGLAPSAIPLLERCRDLRQETLGREHPDSLPALTALATAYWQAARYDEALALSATSDEVWQIRKRVLGPTDARTLWTMTNLAVNHLEAWQFEPALRLSQEALRPCQDHLEPKRRETAFASLTRSRTLLAVRDCEAAAGLLDTTVELCRQAFGPPAVQTRVARLAQTRASSLLGRHAQATAWKEKLAALKAEPK